MKHSAVDLDGGVMLIFDMYNVLSAGGYLAKKIERPLFQTFRVLKVYNGNFALVLEKGRNGEFFDASNVTILNISRHSPRTRLG